jgi:hypothetical protein
MQLERLDCEGTLLADGQPFNPISVVVHFSIPLIVVVVAWTLELGEQGQQRLPQLLEWGASLPQLLSAYFHNKNGALTINE